MKMKRQVPILIADDDLDDCLMIKEALQESRLLNTIHFVHNGEELMNYLHRNGVYEDSEKYPTPGLILLDLNMPRKDGREALKEIKTNPHFCQVPVVILTTSQAEEDIMRTYNLGANSFITKPVTFEALVKMMKDLGRYWFEVSELPHRDDKVEP